MGLRPRATIMRVSSESQAFRKENAHNESSGVHASRSSMVCQGTRSRSLTPPAPWSAAPKDSPTKQAVVETTVDIIHSHDVCKDREPLIPFWFRTDSDARPRHTDRRGFTRARRVFQMIRTSSVRDEFSTYRQVHRTIRPSRGSTAADLPEPGESGFHEETPAHVPAYSAISEGRGGLGADQWRYSEQH